MNLGQSCSELEAIAGLITEELQLIREMRSHGGAPTVEEEVRTYAGAISQIYCLTGPLLIEAMGLELEAAYVAT